MAGTWIDANATAASADDLLDLTPAGSTLRTYRDAVWRDAATDPLLLELCRLRLAQLLGRDPRALEWRSEAVDAGLTAELVDALPRWPSSDLFAERQRAALSFAEQWLFDPSGVTDDDCARLRTALGDAGCAAFTMGLALVEALLRFEMVLGVAAEPRS